MGPFPLDTAESPWHLDLTLGGSPFDASALQRRRNVRLFDRDVWIASPEDLVVYKLVSARGRDLDDVCEVLRTQPSLDGAYLDQWIGGWEEQGIEGIRRRWSELKSS